MDEEEDDVTKRADLGADFDGSDQVKIFPEHSASDEGPSEDSADAPEAPTEGKGEPLSSAMEDILREGGALPTFDASDLLGRTYITDPDENQEQRRVLMWDVDVLKDKTADGSSPYSASRPRLGRSVSRRS